ncbi:MAG: hypothetical protein ACTS27_05300, partial [Phycisphaerales bacterium]
MASPGTLCRSAITVLLGASLALCWLHPAPALAQSGPEDLPTTDEPVGERPQRPGQPPRFIYQPSFETGEAGLPLYALVSEAQTQTAAEIPLAQRPGGPVVATATNRVVAAFIPVVAEYVVANRLRAAGVTGAIQRLEAPSGGGPPNVWVADVETAARAFEVAAALRAAPGIRYAVPNMRFELAVNSIDDPLYADQWHHNNTGQFGGAAGLDSNIEAAWERTLGDGVIVALLDQGVDP